MALSVTSVGDNAQTPGISAVAYIPDQLIAGNLKLVTDNVNLALGTLLRGTVLGQRQLGAPVAVAGKPAGGANAGNGTITAPALGTGAKAGAYVLTFTGATTFTLVAPDGTQLANGATGTAYAGQLGFTVSAGGTAFVAGDGYTITVPSGDLAFVQSVATAKDGSQLPTAILADNADASGGVVVAPVYLQGEFNGNALIMDPSWTLAALKLAMRPLEIYIKSSVSAADPS
jgi:hypothetical protein